MLKGSLLGAIALVGLFSLSQAELNGESVPNEEFPTKAMLATVDVMKMELIDVKYCTKEVIEERASFCGKVTNQDYRPRCENLFGQLVKLCNENLNEIIDARFEPGLLQFLSNKLYTIHDQVTRTNDMALLRADIERYFNKSETYWDSKMINTNKNGVLDLCHRFVVNYQAIKAILKYSDRSTSLSASSQAREASRINEFCRAFSKRYDPEGIDSNLYADI